MDVSSIASSVIYAQLGLAQSQLQASMIRQSAEMSQDVASMISSASASAPETASYGGTGSILNEYA